MKRINNRGFTLIELIGIVVILVAIFLIAFPSLLGITKKDKEKIYTAMLDDLCLAGESYIYSNMDKFPELSTPNSTIKLKISTLVEYGNISKNTVNSKTDKSVINDFLIFTVLSDNSLSCEYKENDGEDAPVICSAVNTSQAGSVKRGVEYKCQVNDEESYNFYVLSTDGDSVNLLMTENLDVNEDGTSDESDYIGLLDESEIGTYDHWRGEDVTNRFGLVETLTSAWDKLTNYNETYTTEGNTIRLSGKARLPKYDEIASLCTCEENRPSNEENRLYRSKCPNWITETSYWTMDFFQSSDPAGWAVHSGYKTLDDFNLYVDSGDSVHYVPKLFGIRPVITVLKTQLEGYDPDNDYSDILGETPPTTCPTTGGDSDGDDTGDDGGEEEPTDPDTPSEEEPTCIYNVYYMMGAGKVDLPSKGTIAAHYYDVYELSLKENIDYFYIDWSYGDINGTIEVSPNNEEYNLGFVYEIPVCEDFTDDYISFLYCDSTSPITAERCDR